MRNRIAGIMHWEHVGIEHKAGERVPVKGTKLADRKTRNPYAAVAVATLLGVALILSLRALFAGPSARA